VIQPEDSDARVCADQSSAFWSGEDDPSIRKITPTFDEYWDRTGAIGNGVKMVKAALTGG
jgi:hypothetical protein